MRGCRFRSSLLLITFLREFSISFPEALHSSPSYVIVTVLSLVDIVMVANLVLLIVFAGYEIFVSKIDTSNSEDRRTGWGWFPSRSQNQADGHNRRNLRN